MKLAEKDTPARSVARTKWLLSSSNKPTTKRAGKDTEFFSRVMAVGYSAASVLSAKSTTFYSLAKMFPILMERYSFLPEQMSTARGAVAIGIMGGAPKLASCRKARKERAACISDSTNWVEATELAMMGSEWQMPPEAKKLEKLCVLSPTTTLPSRLRLPDEQLLLLGAEGYCGGLPLLRKEFLNTAGARAPRRPKLRSVPQEAIQQAKAEPSVLSFTNTAVARCEEQEVHLTSIRDKSYCGIKDNAPASYWKKLLKGQEMEEVETIEASGSFQAEKKEKEEIRPSKMAHKLKMMRSRKMLSKGELRKRGNGILQNNSPSSGRLTSSRRQPTRVARKRNQIVESENEDDEYKITPVHNAPALRVGNRRRSRRTAKKAKPEKPMDGEEVLKKIQLPQNDAHWVFVKHAVELESNENEQVKMTPDELPAEDVATPNIKTLKLGERRAMRRKQPTCLEVADENSYYLVVAPSEIEGVQLDDESLLRDWAPADEASRNYHASTKEESEEERDSDEDDKEAGGGENVEAVEAVGERNDVRSGADEEEQKEAVGNDEEDEPKRVTRSSSRKRGLAAIAEAQDTDKKQTEAAAKRKKLAATSIGKRETRYSFRKRKAAAAVQGAVAATTAVTAAKAVAAAKAAAAAKKKAAGKPVTAAVANGGATTRRMTRASKRAEQGGGGGDAKAVPEQRAESDKLYEHVLAKSGAKTAAHKKQIRSWAGGDYRCFERADDNKLRLELTMSTTRAECGKCSVGDKVVECPRSIVLRLKEGGNWQLVRQYTHVMEVKGSS